jgi:hypothetical protein
MIESSDKCENCGMIDVPLDRGHCVGCVCRNCKRTAWEAGGSMNDQGWCDQCEADLWRGPEPLVQEAKKALRHIRRQSKKTSGGVAV